MSQAYRFLFCLVLLFISPPLASHAELPVEGRVVGPDGQGLAGIRVGLEPFPTKFERLANFLDGKAGPGAAVEVTTDEDGYFELLVPAIGSHKIVVPWSDEGEITAQPPSYIPQEYSLYGFYDAHRLPPVMLALAKTLEIRVVDPDGAPGDARLALYDRRTDKVGWRTRQRLARTGPDGLVRLPWDAGESPWLEVFESSYPKAILTDKRFVVKNGSVEVRLPSDGLAGTIRAINSRGLGVADAVVYQGYEILPLGRTDEDGRFPVVVSPAESEPGNIRIMHHDGSFGYFKPQFAPDEANEITLTLEPPRLIRGQVIDLISRQPVAGAVALLPEMPAVVTDRDGYYALPQTSAFYMDVYSIAPGYALTSEYHNRDEDAAGPIVDGPTIALPPSATVRGRIVDSAGNPIPDVDINVVAVEDIVPFHFTAFREETRQTHSTRSGRFHVSNLPPAMKFELRLRHENFAPTDYIVEGLEAFEDRAQVQITMHSGVSGAGWIVDEDRAPIAGAEVRLVSEEPKSPMQRLVESHHPEKKADGIVTHSDAQGQFRFSRLTPRRYSLEIQALGFAPATVPGLTIDAEPDFTDLGTVVLARGAQIEGIVRDPDGVALAKVEVFFDDEERRLMSLEKPEALATSDADGHFVVPDLQDGKRYDLLVSKLGYGSEKVSADADGADAEEGTLEVVLRPSGTLSGYVLDGDGIPLAQAFVHAGGRSISTDPQGKFRLEHVGPGTVFLSARLEGYQDYVQSDLEVPSRGEVNGLEIILLRGATLIGTVSRADGSPAVGASVTCRPAGPRMTLEDSDITDAEGRFRLDDVVPGPLMIRARLDDYQTVSKDLVVRPGSQTVDLIFEESFKISGRVATEGGRPVVGANLTLKTADGNGLGAFGEKTPSFTSAADGSFTLTGAGAGHYLLTAAKEGYIPTVTPEPFEVGPGAPPEIYLELRHGATLTGRILGLELDDLSQVQVFVTSIGEGDPIQGKVDYDGSYEVPGLGPGLRNVVAGMEDSGRMTVAQVIVEEGVTEAHLDLEFKTGHTVSGVVKSGGEPLSGVAVQAVGMAAGGQTVSDMGLALAETEDDGRFRLNDLPAGKYLLMVMSRTPQFREVEVPTEDDVIIDLGAVRMAGVVRDETSGQPLRGAKVRLERMDPSPSDPILGRLRDSGAQTDSRGHFSLGAASGAWRVIASRAGYSPTEITLSVSAGETYENLEISLSPTEGISFEVTTLSGVLPSRVLTTVLDSSGRSIFQGEVQLGEGAVVRLPTVPAGNWELLVQSASSATVRLSISAPGHLGQVSLPQGGNLRIEVPELTEEKSEITAEVLFTLEMLSLQPQARVRITGASGRPHSVVESHLAVTDQWPMWAGKAEIPGLPPGVWKFTVEHPDGRSWSGEATVTSGEISKVVVGLNSSGLRQR